MSLRFEGWRPTERVPELQPRIRRGAKGCAERREEAAGTRRVRANAEHLRRNTECATQEIRVDAEKTAEALQSGHLALEGGVGEGQLILGGPVPFLNSLLARQVAEAGGAPQQVFPR